MTTKTSPGATSNEHVAHRRDAARLVAAAPRRDRSASGVPTTLSALGPNTFHRERTEIAAPGSAVDVRSVAVSTAVMREPPMTVLRRTSRSAQD